jgi:hypothetical protein
MMMSVSVQPLKVHILTSFHSVWYFISNSGVYFQALKLLPTTLLHRLMYLVTYRD